MIRRSLRIGLRLGLLAGVTFAVVKTVQLRRASSAAARPEPWQPLDVPPPAPAPAPTPPRDEVGEPVLEPAPAVAPGPVLEPAPADPAPWTAEAYLDDTLTMPEVPQRSEPSAEPATAAEPALEAAAQPAPEAAPAKSASKKASAKKAPAKKAAARKAAKEPERSPQGAGVNWVEPVGGTCPPTHPVKAKLSSRIFHLPGMVAYQRTRPNRCYPDAEAAESDGFQRARR